MNMETVSSRMYIRLLLTNQQAWCAVCIFHFSSGHNPLEHDKGIEIAEHSQQEENHRNGLEYDRHRVSKMTATMRYMQ